jgi:ribosome-binding factor A
LSRRTERIGEQLRAELARLLREEATDPRLGLVTLTRVDVSPDLRNARVWWSRMDASDAGEAERAEADLRTREGLESAAGFLRGRLARLMPTKRVPELSFRHDPSLALGTETLSLLRELRDGAGE